METVEVVIFNQTELGTGGERMAEQLFSDSVETKPLESLKLFTFNVYLFYLFCMIFLRISFC